MEYEEKGQLKKHFSFVLPTNIVLALSFIIILSAAAEEAKIFYFPIPPNLPEAIDLLATKDGSNAWCNVIVHT